MSRPVRAAIAVTIALLVQVVAYAILREFAPAMYAIFLAVGIGAGAGVGFMTLSGSRRP